MGSAGSRHGTDPDEARRQWNSRGARMDRPRRRALLHARRTGDPRRRPRRSVLWRPAADLLRCGGGAGHGPACRRDRYKLQCRHQRRIHGGAELAKQTARTFVLPHAPISTHDHSLSDWPKPSSLLPRLEASGAAEFADAYLSWSARGLALATTGQDYFDIDLFAYEGG